MMYRIQVTNTDTGEAMCDEVAETVSLITASDKGFEWQGFKGFWGSTHIPLLEAMTLALEEELEKHGLHKRSERDASGRAWYG